MIYTLNRALGGSLMLDEPMSRHTSFGIGGPAEAMLIPKDAEELALALRVADQMGLETTIMGNGTNLLVKDGGIKGLVLKLAGGLTGLCIDEDLVTVESGVLLTRLSHATVDAGLTGLEFAEGIPGSVGGAVSMNAGAYGGQIKDVVVQAKALRKDATPETLSPEQLRLGYRTSALLQRGLILVETTMRLRPGKREQSRALVKEFSSRRRANQPLRFKSAGSVFKRPEGHYAGKLIEEAGLKGRKMGGAQVSTKHANFIINVDNASANDVLRLIEYVKRTVLRIFGVSLETEIRVVGHDPER